MTGRVGPDVSASGTVPTLRRRLMSMVYESILLFAVVTVAAATGYIFEGTVARYGLPLRHLGQALLFVVLGFYFTWFWTHGGQTLAMTTWRIRLVGPDGAPLRWGHAVARYFLLWLFVLPTLGVLALVGVGGRAALLVLTAAVLLPPFYALVDRDRQFLHDRLLGTRLVTA